MTASALDLPRPVTAVVVAAMDEEARPFLDRLPELRGTDAAAWDLGPAEAWSLALPPLPQDGVPRELQDPSPRELVLVRSGIGLVAAASALAAVLARVSPDVVISAGTAGGLARGIEVGDVCASDTLAYTDADATAFGYVRGQVPGMPPVFQGDSVLLSRARQAGAALAGATPTSGSARIHVGQMLAGNSFVTAANVADTREAFPEAVSTDMETTALAQVAAGRRLPFLSVRGVSDLCGPEAGQDFHIGADEAASRSAAVVLALLS